MKNLIPVSILLLFFITSRAQNINSTLLRYANEFTAERIYLHYDKSTYAPGETVWFKVYMMKTIYPDDKAKTLYIDWTDENGKLLLHDISPVQNGTTLGQFDIPEDYTGHYIHVKAYTKWMLNFDTSFLYNKDIKILSNTNNSGQSKAAIIPELNFFPEGGDAIAGVSNKIAFMANDQYGRPLKIRGDIKNNKGQLITHLSIIHDGMGYFFIKPDPGETFTAYWEDEKGTKHTTLLPQVKKTGVSLLVTISGTKRNFFVHASPSFSDTNNLHVLGTMFQQPIFNITRQLKNGVVEGSVPTENLPSGILVITVFNNKWEPLAERITYINNEEYFFTPQMTVQHWGLNKRAKDEIEISVPDSITANLSVSVTDLAIDYDTSDNIISHLLLSGELKGKINNPSYYFINNSDSIMQQLDLVMLTHGWRRFDWEKIVNGQYPEIKYSADTSYLSLSGRVFGATPSQLRAAGQIVLMVSQKKKETQIYSVPLESNGLFNDPSLILFDTARIYYQLPKSSGLSDVSVQFLQNRLPPFENNSKATGFNFNHLADTTGDGYHFHLNNAAQEELKFLKAKVLATVTIKANPKSATEKLDEKYASGLFSGGDGYQFDVLDDKFALASQNIFQYLQGKVAGLQINTTSNPPTLSWRGGTPQLYVDEMLSDASMISSVPVTDIAYIKVFRPPFMGPSGGGSGGAIAIYTRKGGDIQSSPDEKGLSHNLVSGYTAIRQFYSPDYESFSEANDKKDLRTTLYWNPSVNITPDNNKVVLKFFNNDVTNAFRIVIEGMSRDGRLAHIVQTME